MTIYNLEKFIDSLWDWGILDGCFGNTKIRPTDIDGLVEKNGKFLLLEGKSPGKEIPIGQEIMFNHLVKTYIFTIIVIWGTPNTPVKLKVFHKDKTKIIYPATIDDLRNMVNRWYRWTTGQQIPRLG